MTVDVSRPATTGQPTVVIQEGACWWRFHDLQQVIKTHNPGKIPPALRRIEQAVEKGLYAAGFLTYEAAAAYNLATHDAPAGGLPLLWFGLFRHREATEAPKSAASYEFGNWESSLNYDLYHKGIDRIKREIATAYTYQANFTFRLKADFSGDPWALYAYLCRAQRAAFTAYLDLGQHIICSASPELFFRLDGNRIESRPMKGTAARGLTAARDRANMAWLRRSEKNRAENVMIVDMIRNDIGRVATTGSVSVPELFNVERYPTLLQMTSTVTGRTQRPLADILESMYPCASITGAPKVRTMDILRDLEESPRGLYTGTIGFMAPGRKAQFNVAIRTVVIDRQQRRATYGVGSGIVWDSDARSEYDECLLKARVLQRDERLAAPFSLIETLRWTPERGYYLLEAHLRRLKASASYFTIPFTKAATLAALFRTATQLHGSSKVRLLLDESGKMTVTHEPLSIAAEPPPLQLGLAVAPIDSGNRWLYHKTTVRDMYEIARASRPDCDDVVLWNERGEITESSRANIVVELDGRLVTPPVSSGLLAGTLRSHLLDTNQIEPVVLLVNDLSRATAIHLINAVRGWIPAEFNVDLLPQSA